MHVELLVYSATGNTSYLALLFEQSLRTAGHTVGRRHLESMGSDRQPLECDVLGIGSPVYHTAPPARTRQVVERLRARDLPLFTFWSMGLYAGNCARILQRAAVSRGFRPVANFEAVFPGVDFAAQLPNGSPVNRWLNMRIARNLPERVRAFAATLSPNMPERIERPRWYVPLNDIARARAIPIYERYKRSLHALPQRCTRGGWCVEHCPEDALRLSSSAVEIDVERCSFCLRCYHGCPAEAIQIGTKRRGRYAGPHEARGFVAVHGYPPPPVVCREG